MSVIERKEYFVSEILEVVTNVAITGCCLFCMQPEQDKFAAMYMGKS
jgi:hypothetical protein